MMKIKAKIAKKTPPRRSSPARKPPTRLARMLALAHYVDRLVESGAVKNYAAVAGKLSISRARVAQVVNLLNLSPELQERILRGDLPVSERCVRSIDGVVCWAEQRNMLNR